MVSFNGNPLEKIWLKHVETEGKVGNNEAINETKRSFPTTIFRVRVVGGRVDKSPKQHVRFDNHV